MTKLLILYYSSYGHLEAMARAAAEGGRSAGAEVDVKRMPETVPDEVVKRQGFRVNDDHPVAAVDDLPDYDAIIVGTPTNYGNAAAQVTAFWARTTGLWKDGKLIGKVGGAMSSSGSQHGGNEAALLSMHKTMLHHGMIIVGLPYSFQGQLETDQVVGGSPYGATTIAGRDMSRQPSVTDLDGAKFQGRHTAEVASKLRADAA